MERVTLFPQNNVITSRKSLQYDVKSTSVGKILDCILELITRYTSTESTLLRFIKFKHFTSS